MKLIYICIYNLYNLYLYNKYSQLGSANTYTEIETITINNNKYHIIFTVSNICYVHNLISMLLIPLHSEYCVQDLSHVSHNSLTATATHSLSISSKLDN